MHTKINKQPNDLAFLTHFIWSKTRLGMQHIHLELLWILTYASKKKNKHISRINIYDNYKIVINSSKEYFSITRQHAELATKIKLFLSTKNYLGKFFINRKQFK
jgi:hypothetical protein